MSPSSITSELPSYAHATELYLPSYEEQWDEDRPLTPVRPMPAHTPGRDRFTAGPELEAQQHQAPSAMQYQAPSPQPRPAPRTLTRSAAPHSTGCCGGCGSPVMALFVPSAIISGVVLIGTSVGGGAQSHLYSGIALASVGLLTAATKHAGRSRS